MKKRFIYWLSIALVILIVSCNGNQLTGKKYYLLTGNTSGYVPFLKEIEFEFVSNDKVEAKMLLYADPTGYKIINDSSEDASSKIYSYKYEKGILEVPDFKTMARLEFLNDGGIITNEGEHFYPTSIVPVLGTQKAEQRIEEISKSKTLAQLYKRMLDKPIQPLIRTENGRIIFNKDNSSTGMSEKDALRKQYNSIISKIDSELGTSPELTGTLGEKYAEVEKVRKSVWQKLDGNNVNELRELLNQLDYKSKDLFSDIKKLKDENRMLSDGKDN